MLDEEDKVVEYMWKDYLLLQGQLLHPVIVSWTAVHFFFVLSFHWNLSKNNRHVLQLVDKT